MKIDKTLGLLAILIFLLIVVGGLVRNLGAGLSCPDWPLCQGRLIPQFDLRVFAEYFHRLFALAVSVLTLALSGLIFFKPLLRSHLGKPMALALLLLTSQVVLGGLTVLKLLQSEIVTLHLATGSLFFLTVLFMALKAHKNFHPSRESYKGSDNLLKWGKISLIVVYFQILLGGIVSSHYAGLACPDFPTCLGEWWPKGFDPNVHIQFAHRLGAATVFCTVLYFALKSVLSWEVPKSIRIKATLVLFFLCLQVLLGISNVVFRLPVALSVGHLAVAEALIALILITTYEIGHLKLHQSH
jgi:cytochrome c oxidase assembly protein subunit 15